jgi:transposase-like protein
MATAAGINVTLMHYVLMALVSITTVGSFTLVGAILVVAMLVVPAATAYLLTDDLKKMLVISVACGVLSSTFGYLAAERIDVSCPSCGHTTSVNADKYSQYEGKRAKCKGCSETFVVPAVSLAIEDHSLQIEQQRPPVSVTEALVAVQARPPEPQYQCGWCAGWFMSGNIFTAPGDAGYICKRCNAEQNQARTAPPAIQQSVVIQNVVHAAPRQRWSPGVAALLSFIFPGLGQLYKGQVINGLVWMVVVFVGYCMLVIPGVILHIICIAGAASGDPHH